MRLFVALDLPDNIKDYFYDLQNRIGSEYAKIRWVSKKQMHLTLKFLGEIKDNELDKIKDNLKEIKFKKFGTMLEKIGFFPNEKKINVIWVGLKPDNEIITLQKRIDEMLINYGEKEKFSAHITLGRVKFVKNKDKFLRTLKDVKVSNLSFNADEFKLFNSILTKDGPVHEVLETFRLI